MATLDTWLNALPDMKRSGHEWHGPCPLCGGVDRFWIKEGRDVEVLVSCRQCKPNGREATVWFSYLRRVLFGAPGVYRHEAPRRLTATKEKLVPVATARRLILEAMAPGERAIMENFPSLAFWTATADFPEETAEILAKALVRSREGIEHRQGGAAGRG